MDSLGVTIGIISGGIIAFTGFILGLYAEHLIYPKPQIRQRILKSKPIKKEIKEEPPIPQKPDLGGVSRPTPDEIEKMEHPEIKEVEEEWDKGFKQAGIKIMESSAAAVMMHPNAVSGVGGVWMK